MIRYDIQRGVQKIKTKTFIAISSLGLVLGGGAMSLAILGSAHADSQNINFEPSTYTLGNINGQDGWTKTGGFDAAVSTNATGYSSLGTQSLRISDSVTSGSFGDQTFSKPLANEAGETDAQNNGMSGGTRQPHFEAQFDLASVLPTVQTGMHVSVSPDRGDGARMSYLRFEDQTNGIHAFFDDVTDAGPAPTAAVFNETDIATLTRSPHTIKFSMDFVDGPGNDVVKIYIDGSLIKTGTSWENYYRFDPESSTGNNSRTVDSLLFRVSGVADPSNAGNGFLFDNLSLMSGPVPSSKVKVQIFKYVDGVQATATNANSATFPMTTTFTSPNLGNASNVPFTLSPTPWGGIGHPYEADFIGSDAGADYTASEVTTGNNVVGTTCDSTTPYALTGYSFGSNLAQAQAASKTLTAPQFTNLQSDQVVIVYNKTCHNVTKPVITYPANGSTKNTIQMDKVDWTDVTGATAYEYRSFTDAAYTAQAYDTGFTLATSQIPTPGTPPGDYYLQVRAQDADGNVSQWSNDAAHPYVVHVVAATTPPTTKDECRNNGWKTFNNPSYKNKDKCIDYVVSQGHKVRGDIYYTANGLKREAEFDMNTYDNNKGDFEYWDNNRGHYVVKVSLVKVNGQDAYFAGVVTKASDHNNVGKWLYAKVHDGSPDQISGIFTNQATATAHVNSMSPPAEGPFNVTKGNLKVN